MEALFSKDELQGMAHERLKEHKVSEIFATVDGQFFLKRHFADNHAGKYGTVHTFKVEPDKALEQSKQKPAPLSVQKIADLIITIDDVEELTQMLTAETEGLNRVTAVKAIQARIDTLQQ